MMAGYSFRAWPEQRRMLIEHPVPLEAFAGDSSLMRNVMGIVGSDAVILADVGAHLGGMAMCLPADADAWRRELGLSPKGGG